MGLLQYLQDSASTLSKAFASYASSSLTTRVSLLSFSDKSTADVVECADVWTELLDPFALHVPSHRTWLADSGLVERDVLCAVMTIIAGVGFGSL